MAYKKIQDFTIKDPTTTSQGLGEDPSTPNKWIRFAWQKVVDLVENVFTTKVGADKIVKVNSAGTDLEGKTIDEIILSDVLTTNDRYMARVADTIVQRTLPDNSLPKSYISGFFLSKNAIAGINIGFGATKDDTYTYDIELINSITKIFTTFQAGTGYGGLDVGSSLVANRVYYIYVIGHNILPVDVLFSLSKTAPTMPTGYTKKKIIGNFFTDASSILVENTLNSSIPYYVFGATGRPLVKNYVSSLDFSYLSVTTLTINELSCRSDDNKINIRLFDDTQISTTTYPIGNVYGTTIAADTQYYIFAATKDDGDSIFVFIVNSLTPTLPTGYNYKRQIGEFKTRRSSAEILENSLKEVGYVCDCISYQFNTPLSGVIDDYIFIIGVQDTLQSGLTANYSTPFGIGNNHLCLLINSISSSGSVLITGTSLSEITAVPVASDTETITIDSTASQRYQTSKKWLEIDSIAFSGITLINYDIESLGYLDLRNRNFNIIGYRAEFYAAGTNADIALKIMKVQDDSNGKVSIHDIEYLGFDSGSIGNQIIDSIRTGADDRSYNPTVSQILENNGKLVFKMNDFNTYFEDYLNRILGSEKNEGIIVQVVGCPSGGVSNIDWMNLEMDFRILS